MPRFSIIVPVFKVQGFLHECIDSVLGQSYPDFEVIAVDDRSPDGCGAILDEYAERDARVRVLHLPENVGLGRARNAGLAEARGDYVLFLDSDDFYTPGLLAAVAERLTGAEDPDILVFDHVRTHWWGRGGRSEASELLARAGLDTFDLRTSPEYARLFLVAWNKAYRRDFFQGHGLQYAPGLYEDAPVTYRSMVLAERIACLNRIGVEYRQRRQGAITKTPGRRHFDIFPQYEGLFAFLKEREDLAWARPLLFERALDHMLFVIAREDRVTPADRRDFHREIRAFYARHCPEGFTPPEGPAAPRCGCWPRRPTRRSRPCAGRAVCAGWPGRASAVRWAGPRRRPDTPTTRPSCGSRSTRTSRCTRRRITPACTVIRRRSTPRPANSPRTSGACGWCVRTRWTRCRPASSM